MSRSISKIVLDGHLKLFKGPKNSTMPQYCFYVDDLIVYCNGRLSNLNAPKEVLCRYSSCSGQFINADKSTVFKGIISHIGFTELHLFLAFKLVLRCTLKAYY